MTEETGRMKDGVDRKADAPEQVNSRRGVLKLGAIAVPAIATLSPSMAMATNGGANISLMTCSVPMHSFWYDEYGHPVDDGHHIKGRDSAKPYYMRNGNKVWVFRGPSGGSYSGQQLKDAFPSGYFGHRVPPEGNKMQFDAHVAYLEKVRSGQIPGAGMTCLVSLTNV
ncbi:MAG: hypothetical protein WA979_08655 [Pacificimonas sp.]